MLQRLYYLVILFTAAAIVFLAASLLSTPTQAAIPTYDIQDCTNVIRRGDFEGVFSDIFNEWPSADLARFTNVAYNSNRGVLFEVGPARQPTIYQSFTIPAPVFDNATAQLQLKKAVDLNGESNPEDKFYVELRRVSDGAVVAGPILLADGQDRTLESPPIPDFDPSLNAPEQWTDFSHDLFAGINPASLLNASDEVRLYFYTSPDASITSSTKFYLDDVSLTICTNIKKVYLPIILKQYDPSHLQHNLSINKTASASVVKPTDLLTYTLQYSVNGNQPAPGLTLVDNLPEYVTFQSCTGGLVCSESNGTVTWRLGDVPAGTNGMVKTVVRVNDQVFTTPVLSNTATLRDSSGLTVNDTVITFITDEHELSVSQTAVYTGPTVYQPYYPLTYTIHYTVSGNGIAPALTLFDTLPQSTTYFSCSGGLTCNEANGEVTWNLGSVLPNTTGIVTVALALDELWFKYGTALQNTIVLTDTTGKIVTDTHTLPIPRDIAILFDMSGSMQFDTAGYGFYEPFGDGSVPWYNIDNGLDYPNPDYIHRIPTTHLPTTDCGTNCGPDNVPYIQIFDNLGDFSEPQGGNFTIAVYNHLANTAYTAWFVHNTNPGYVYSLDFTTDNLGSRLLNFVISRSALPTPSGPEYKIYTTLRNNTLPMATCLGDLPTSAPCFQVTENNAAIEARNITQGDQQQQPLGQARWPISSSIPIYLFGHDIDTDYTMKFNGQTASVAPGELMFDGSTSNVIPTDSQFGTNQDNIPGYYIATNHSSGDMLISSENGAGSEMAATTVELVIASIDIAGEEPYKFHPADDVLWITLRDHAPLQQYQIVFEDGITPPAIVRANDRGELAFNYVVPHSVQEPCANVPEPGCEPVPVNIYTLDHNRGLNPNKIAQQTIFIFTPINPYINVPGGAQWPGGSPIAIQLRYHMPNTQYRVFLQQGSPDNPMFSQLIGSAIVTDNEGRYNIAYQLPIDLDGYYSLRSFEVSNLSQPVAEFNLRIISEPAPITALNDQPGLLSSTDSLFQAAAIPGAQNEGQLCWQRDGNIAEYFTVGGGGDAQRYVVIEAELYSANDSLLAGPFRQPGQGYWAVQHSDIRVMSRMFGGSYGIDATPILNDPNYRGSWVTHNPYITWAVTPDPPDFLGVLFGYSYTLDEVRANPNGVPSLEYDFITASDWETAINDSTRVWIRAQGGGNWADGPHDVFWAVYEYTNLYGAANGDPTQATPLGSGNIERASEQPNTGVDYGGARSDRWSWEQLTSGLTNLDLENSTRYTLKIWAGESGYDIDQIVIGNRNDAAFTTNYSSGATTLQATPGSAFRQACNRCNPIYGLTVDQADCLPPNDNGDSIVPQDSYDLSHPDNNPLYSGYQPIRGAKEGVKHFIRNLNPQFDQVGVVGYSTTTPSQAKVELRCLKHDGSDCYTGINPISYTEALKVVEQVPPDGSTNIAQAILKGLEMLGINADQKATFNPTDCVNSTDHCARGGAARRILILMSDGVANQNPYDQGASSVNCYATDLYQPNTGDTYVDKANDCVMHYGQIAANSNVTIYTIGLGNGVDAQLLQTVADLPGVNGAYYGALYPAQLNDIFDAILEANQ